MMEKQYRKTTPSNLQHIQAHLKQDLRIESQRLRREKRYVNRMFKIAQKKSLPFV